MMQKGSLVVSPSPHFTKKNNTTQSIMLHVLIALLPVTLAAIIIFGYLVAVNVIFCVLFCMGLEMLYNMLIKKQWNKEGLKDNSVWDLSPAVTGVILALNLPTNLNIWGLNITSKANAAGLSTVYFSFDTIIVCFLGSLVAIVLVKMLFGGIGKNFANPAAVGRIFLMMAFASAFNNIYFAKEGLQAVTEATWLQDKVVGEVAKIPLLDMFLGTTGSAAVGETCVIAILLGYIYLCITKVIDFRIPLTVVISALVFLLLFDGYLKYIIHNAAANSAAKASGLDPELITNPLSGIKDYGEFLLRHLLSGGLLFGAVFMATDYSSSPKTFWGRIVFAIGIGFFVAVIRTWAMAEGMIFSLVIMNMFTPLIDKVIKPRPFGLTKHKKNQQATGDSNTQPLSDSPIGGAKA